MNKKIVGILVMMLLIFFTLLPAVEAIVIDQHQDDFSGYDYLSRYGYHAQSFKPTLPVLKKVMLYLNTYHWGTDMKVSIRDMLNEGDLTSITISTSDINPEATWTWVDFDFPDIDVEVGETYYIEVEHYSAGDIDLVAWGRSVTNPYSDGEAWHTVGWDWFPIPEDDFCFRTYGGKGRSKDSMDLENEFSNLLIQTFFDQHPNLFPLLRQLLGI